MNELKDIEEYFKEKNYKIIDGWLYRIVTREKGDSVYPVSNFIAYIDSEEIYDDGYDIKRLFVISGIHSEGFNLPMIKVLSSDFQSCNWIAKN